MIFQILHVFVFFPLRKFNIRPSVLPVVSQRIDVFVKIHIDEIDESFYLEAPGNIIRYLKIIDANRIASKKDKINCIYYLFETYKKKKNPEILTLISSLVELFYNELSLSNSKYIDIYFYNKFKILKYINDVKKFNLDKNNLFFLLKGILENES